MSRLPPIPSGVAHTPEGQSMLRAFERLCAIETGTEVIARDLASLTVGTRITDLVQTINRNRDEAMRVNIRVDQVVAAPRPSPPGGTPGGGAKPRPTDPGPGPEDPDNQALVRKPDSPLSVVLAVDAAFPGLINQSCVENGGNNDFLDEVIRRLRLDSERWGYLCVRLDCTDNRGDQVGYFSGLESPPVQQSHKYYNWDIIANHCSAGNQQPQALDRSRTDMDDNINLWKFPK